MKHLHTFKSVWLFSNVYRARLVSVQVNFRLFIIFIHCGNTFLMLPLLHQTQIFRNTFTGLASTLILPQVTASSGLAPESEPSDSWPVFTYTAKSAPFFCQDINQHIELTRIEFDFIFMVLSIEGKIVFECIIILKIKPFFTFHDNIFIITGKKSK